MIISILFLILSLPLPSSVSMLADKLSKAPDDAERWIVNLIREARLDAKIDAKKVIYSSSLSYPLSLSPFSLSQGHIVMNPQPQSIYQRVIDRTKSIGFQTQFLAQCIEKVKGSNSGRPRGHFETSEGRASVSHLILYLLQELVRPVHAAIQ